MDGDGGARRGRWDPLRPSHAWEIPTAPVTLVAGALAIGRPGGPSGPRLDGLDEAEVAARYARLRTAVLGHAVAAGSDVLRFETLERSAPETPASRWQTWAAASGACDDRDVVRLARELWEALGPNEYARVLESRPRTARGFAEGRAWVFAAAFPSVLLLLAAADGAGGGALRLTMLVAGFGWPVLVVTALFRRRRRLERIGGAELPHA